jgi:hypothetical protein
MSIMKSYGEEVNFERLYYRFWNDHFYLHTISKILIENARLEIRFWSSIGSKGFRRRANRNESHLTIILN